MSSSVEGKMTISIAVQCAVCSVVWTMHCNMCSVVYAVHFSEVCVVQCSACITVQLSAGV